MKKGLIVFCALFLTISAVNSQKITRANLELRSSYHINGIDKEINNETSGFKGNYYQFLLSGDITDKLHFDFRQKFNKYSSSSSFFDATDKALLIYNPTDFIDIKIGKRPLSIGGCDYGIIPIDLYFTGQYCDLLTIYQWGVSTSYTTKSKNDTFLFELTQSPFWTYSSNPNIYAYTGYWEGHHGMLDILHSVHLFGTETGKYINWIMLGHRFNLGKITTEFDYLNKYSMSGKEQESNNKFFFNNYSLVGKVIYNPTENMSFAIKYCYDVNNSKYESLQQMNEENCDYHVLPGTEINRFGGIIEYYPLKDKMKSTLRFHLAAYQDWGTNTNPDATVIDKQFFITTGMTLKLALK